MSNSNSLMNSKTLLALSLAANIFMGSFMLGRLSMQPPCPPHEMSGQWKGGPHGGPHGGPDGGPPPGGKGGPPNDKDAGRRPPPPFMSPAGLFTPEEMKAEFGQMQETFSKMDAMRKAFAEKLKTSKATKEEVLRHFDEVDALMQGARKVTQEKAADKISNFTDEQRADFAQKLLEERPGPGQGPGPNRGKPPEFPNK